MVAGALSSLALSVQSSLTAFEKVRRSAGSQDEQYSFDPPSFGCFLHHTRERIAPHRSRGEDGRHLLSGAPDSQPGNASSVQALTPSKAGFSTSVSCAWWRSRIATHELLICVSTTANIERLCYFRLSHHRATSAKRRRSWNNAIVAQQKALFQRRCIPCVATNWLMCPSSTPTLM